MPTIIETWYDEMEPAWGFTIQLFELLPPNHPPKKRESFNKHLVTWKAEARHVDGSLSKVPFGPVGFSVTAMNNFCAVFENKLSYELF